MIILILVPVFLATLSRAELYNQDGKVKNVVQPVFQYNEVDNLKECWSQAKELGPTYYCK